MATAPPSFRTPVTYADAIFGDWNPDKAVHFMWHTHLPFAFGLTTLYIVMVHVGPRIMEKRPAFDLRRTLAIWNFALAAFSGWSLFRTSPDLFGMLYNHGLKGTMCYTGTLYTNPYTGYWTWMFALSKGPELIDTVFLILRKRQVIFLHWYHHALTFVYGTYGSTLMVPWIRWIVNLNLFVHTIMYFYFGIRAIGWRTPSLLSKMITLTQITQFSTMFVWLYLFYSLYDDPDCKDANFYKLGEGSVIVASYLILFIKFYRDSYGEKKRQAKKAKDAEFCDVNGNVVDKKAD